jgi:hypothetical protein
MSGDNRTARYQKKEIQVQWRARRYYQEMLDYANTNDSKAG